MKKAELKQHLSQFKDVTRLVMEANKLKASGESEIMVNRCVSELRRDMLSAAASIKRIPRVQFNDTPMEVTAYIPVQVDNLSAPVVAYDGEFIVI